MKVSTKKRTPVVFNYSVRFFVNSVSGNFVTLNLHLLENDVVVDEFNDQIFEVGDTVILSDIFKFEIN